MFWINLETWEQTKQKLKRNKLKAKMESRYDKYDHVRAISILIGEKLSRGEITFEYPYKVTNLFPKKKTEKGYQYKITKTGIIVLIILVEIRKMMYNNSMRKIKKEKQNGKRIYYSRDGIKKTIRKSKHTI